MDERDLTAATRRWVRAGLIDDETADALLEYERSREREQETNRLTAIVAIMGAVLVGAGVVALLVANWDRLGTALQTVLVTAAPVAAGALGLWFDRRHRPRVGHALWSVAALLAGPSLFMLRELHTSGTDVELVLLVWGLLALPMGHAFRARLPAIVGLAALLIAVALSDFDNVGLFLAAAVATLPIAVSSTVPRQLRSIYRSVGLLPPLLVLLWLNTFEGDVRGIDLEPTLGLGLALAVAVIALMIQYGRGDGIELRTLAGVPVVATVGSLGLLLLTGVPSIVVLVLGQGLLLAVLLTIVWVGVAIGSRWLINLVTLGFLLQVLTLLATVTDYLSGGVALIVGGTVLVVVAALLEGGRRRVLRHVP